MLLCLWCNPPPPPPQIEHLMIQEKTNKHSNIQTKTKTQKKTDGRTSITACFPSTKATCPSSWPHAVSSASTEQANPSVSARAA